ncbi:MAG: FAD-binding oxidoreductase, partial [Thalassovita sp.]|nr:FAD-binding oxidoreductase [Thalassovita sp.]
MPDLNLWRASSSEAARYGALERDLSVDLAVIGGGYTGCCAALEGARRGASVALLEADTIGHGGSGRNVGLVNAGLWLPPDDVIATLGENAGLRLINTLSEGPARVFELIEREAIDCEATRNGTLHLAHAPAGVRDLQNRHDQGGRIGAPLRLLDRSETAHRTGSEAFHGALFDPGAGTVQPLAYCRGLARAAHAAGAQLFEHTPVTAIARQDGTWRLSANGRSVRARSLLLATNGYHRDFTSPCAPRYAPVQFSQFATAPLPEALRQRILPGGEGCWDTALVMSSFRVDRAGRLILGGMGNAEGMGAAIHRNWARSKLRRVFPELTDIGFEHRWTGRIAMTGDHIPKVVEFGPSAY